MDAIVTPGSELGKRKRSPSSTIATTAIGLPVAKTSKTSSGNSLSINYLARQTPEDLPLLNKDDTLPNLLNLIAAYGSVLDRHESLASNLGARPLGPILIKRFERCFDGPPKIVLSHQKTSSTQQEEASPIITWLEVIEFARSHPSQFTLSTFSEGRRVCQFYYPQKQVRVQISEEDFLFINSGRCQELIPPLPIWEDEEKEVGACDVLDAKLRELTNAADMVAARTRQLSHRLRGRRAAIVERRAEGGIGTPAKAGIQQITTAPPLAPSGPDYHPVNHAETQSRHGDENHDRNQHSFTAVRSELLRHFESLPHNQNLNRSQARNPSMSGLPEGATPTRHHEPSSVDTAPIAPVSAASSMSPAPNHASVIEIVGSHAPETPRGPGANSAASANHRPPSSMGGPANQASLKHNFSRPLNPVLESSQPFRPLCQAHMDSLPRGHRVLPPCDRCRRLRMDCVKNLTSCAGCTKKHARCHWRDVTRDELGTLDHLMDRVSPEAADPANADHVYANGQPEESDEEESNPLQDLEAVGDKQQTSNPVAVNPPSDQRRATWGGVAAFPRSQTETIESAERAQIHDRNDTEEHRPSHVVQRPQGHEWRAKSIALDEVSHPGADRVRTSHIVPDNEVRSDTSHGGFRAVNDHPNQHQQGHEQSTNGWRAT